MRLGRWHPAIIAFNTTSLIMLLGAASSEQLPQLSNVEFSDTLSQSSNVSGITAAGVLVGQLDAPIKPVNLYVWLPPHARGHVCANIISKDGLYQATLSAQIPSGASGPTRVIATSKYAADLQRYRAGDLAVLAWMSHSACASEESNGYIAVAWQLTTSPRPLYVLVNSEDSSSTRLAAKNAKTGITERFTCVAANGIVLIGFNTVCEVGDLSLLDLTSMTIEIEDIDPRDPIDLPIRLSK